MSPCTRRLSKHAIRLGCAVLGIASLACVPHQRGNNPLPLYTRQDSVRAAIARVHGLVRAIDREGRATGALPQTLIDSTAEPGFSGRDPWGRDLQYSATGRAFEIRSAGSDGTMGTADDIVAVGRLGRAIPCEIRHDGITTTWDRVAPACERMKTERIYPLCPSLSRSDRVDRSIPPTQRDSILAVGQRLVRVARAIDGYGREIGTTPETLTGPEIWGRMQDGQLLDLWGSGVRYRISGEEFELASAGPDHNLDTADDIIVRAAIGSGVACVFRTEWGEQRCAEPTPAC
jgi:hypothetical protein